MIGSEAARASPACGAGSAAPAASSAVFTASKNGKPGPGTQRPSIAFGASAATSQ